MTDQITYHLEDFDGPLDLLLHLIHVNEMDILIFKLPKLHNNI
ncbi:segregation and condensation protein A [Weissella viridescens]|uniref:Segregation and condensation protein A n=1 Tax=Weissella viridescens TaxID=1629 RepID=A0A380P2E1_WEIVI|nr:segregation and condensation protein A [Weissella viridescens]